MTRVRSVSRFFAFLPSRIIPFFHLKIKVLQPKCKKEVAFRRHTHMSKGWEEKRGRKKSHIATYLVTPSSLAGLLSSRIQLCNVALASITELELICPEVAKWTSENWPKQESGSLEGFSPKGWKHNVLSFISHFISSTKDDKRQFEIHNAPEDFNFEISQVVFMPNITYKSCYYLFILLPAKILKFSHVGISNQAEIPLLWANQIAEISHVVV